MKKWSHEGKLTIDNDELLPSQCCIYKSCVFNIFHCPLPIAHCPLPIAYCPLPIINYFHSFLSLGKCYSI